MIDRFKQHLDSKFSFLKNKKLLVAVSGGIDSVVLAHLLKKLDYDIHIAHCNFQLRGAQSDADEKFVMNLALALEVHSYTKKFNTISYANEKKQSTQIAARELRYTWFEELHRNHGLDFLLTAHHADDNIETFLINFTRGSGLDGLTGIPAINGNIIRPLLHFSQEDITDFAKKNTIAWREDLSNAEIKYTRNKIRHLVIPVLKEINPSLVKSFNASVEYLKNSQRLVRDYIEEKKDLVVTEEKGILKLNIAAIRKIPNKRTFLFFLLRGYGFTEWNDVYHLMNAQTGKLITTKSYTLLKDRDFLLLLPSDKFSSIDNQSVIVKSGVAEIKRPVNLLFKNVDNTTSLGKNTIYVDKKLLNYPLTLRKWSQGDFFYPKGMKGRKKVSKYFKDEKLSRLEKQNIWILCSSKNEIIWILGKRQDRRFAATEKTTSILQICIYQPL